MYDKVMDNYDIGAEDKILKTVGLELMFLTPEKCSSEDGITAVELAKLVGIPAETVKKKLNILKDKDIVKETPCINEKVVRSYIQHEILLE